MNKLEYLAGLGGNDLLDNTISKYQCPHKTYCPGHKYHMRCDYIRSKCRINRFYNKWITHKSKEGEITNTPQL